MKKTSIRKIGMKKTKKGGYYYQGFTFAIKGIYLFILCIVFIKILNSVVYYIISIYINYTNINTYNKLKDIHNIKIGQKKIFGTVNDSINAIYENILKHFMDLSVQKQFTYSTFDYVDDTNQKILVKKKLSETVFTIEFVTIMIFILNNRYNIYNFFKIFYNNTKYPQTIFTPKLKKIAKTITDVAQDKKIAVNEVRQLFPNEPDINAVKTIADAKELLTGKIEEATKTLIVNQPSSTIINQKDIEMLKSSNLTQNAEDFLKTSKPTSILDKITNSINSTNELYLQLENKTTETKTYIANFITKQKENIHQIKTDILAIGKSANSTIYEKTIGSLTKLFVLPTIDNLQDVFKNPNPEKIIKMLGTIFVLLSATYILTKVSIELYKWLFGIKMEENKIDLSKLSTEEKEIIKRNEEKLKKMEKEVLEKVAKGQKILTSKKTPSKSK